MGYLGGPNFPDDPTDLGPLVPLPGGFEEVFEYPRRVGYSGFEFFQFSQNADELGRQPTTPRSGRYLDNAGPASFGTHTGGLGDHVRPSPAASRRTASSNSRSPSLGHTLIGTAGDPSEPGDARGPSDNPVRSAGPRLHAARTSSAGSSPAQDALVLAPRAERRGSSSTTRRTRSSRAPTGSTGGPRTPIRARLLRAGHLALLLRPGRFPDPVDGSMWDAFGFWTGERAPARGLAHQGRHAAAPHPCRRRNPFTQASRAGRSLGGRPNPTPSTRARDPSRRATRSTRTRLSSVSRSLRRGRSQGRAVVFVESDSGIGAAPTRAARSGTRRSGSSTCSASAAGPST